MKITVEILITIITKRTLAMVDVIVVNLRFTLDILCVMTVVDICVVNVMYISLTVMLQTLDQSIFPNLILREVEIKGSKQ